MYPGHYANVSPSRPAAIAAATGQSLSFAELDSRSSALAGYLRAQGLRQGDSVALYMENQLTYFEVAWAALRSGLYLVTISQYATPDDIAYMVADSGARALITSARLLETAQGSIETIDSCGVRLAVGAGSGDPDVGRWKNYDAVVAAAPPLPRPEEQKGDHMPYSSGTTGRPKGIRRPFEPGHPSEGFASHAPGQALYGFDDQTVYLSPAPLYHTAPIQFCLRVQSAGGTVVMMERFEAEAALRAIEAHAVTHSQWVPTMFVRMMKLDDAQRLAYDLSSHRCAVHAAAPCPVEIKRQMIEWWGPIIEEYYAGSERNGSTYISSEEWLRKPGSVGRPNNCTIHICDESGAEQPPGEAGTIYLEQAGASFVYHNDPAKTEDSQHPDHPGWTTLGDVGYVDEDGYLYLTDRKSFMIISGGVNIYPRIIEDALILHPDVADVAVIGVPNEEFGEEVKAIVEPAPGATAGPDLADRLIAFARDHLAHYMVPRSVDFLDRMPRLPTGKLPKRLLRAPYWETQA